MISFEYLTGGFESETHPGAHELVHVTEMSKMPEVPDVFFCCCFQDWMEFFFGLWVGVWVMEMVGKCWDGDGGDGGDLGDGSFLEKTRGGVEEYHRGS